MYCRKWYYTKFQIDLDLIVLINARDMQSLKLKYYNCDTFGTCRALSQGLN